MAKKNRRSKSSRKAGTVYDKWLSKKSLSPTKFYATRVWKELRVRVLEAYSCSCMMCGRSPKEHRVILHVDHIKPRSKYPELELVFSNLQILCADCNLGKSNKYQTDHRPDTGEVDEYLDGIHLENIRHL